MKKHYLPVVILITLVLGGVLYFAWDSSKAKCPDDYKNPDDAVAAFDVWTKNFFENNPDASLDEMAQARIQYYLNNGCKAALERVSTYTEGSTDGDTELLLQEAVRNAVR